MLEFAYADENPEEIMRIIEGRRLDRTEFKESLGLACSYASYVSKGYPATYYKSGLIFRTEAVPLWWLPFDEWNLRLGPYLAGYERFMFDSLDSMLAQFPDSISAQKAATNWRHLYESILNGRYDSDMEFSRTTDGEMAAAFQETIKFVYGTIENAKAAIESWKARYQMHTPPYRKVARLDIRRLKPACTEVLFDIEIEIEPVAIFGMKFKGLASFERAVDYF